MAKKKWISKALSKHRTGVLHERLKVPKGKRIPVAKLRKAATGSMGPKTAKRARLALTLRGLRRRKAK